jgi:hypothetical protein
MCYLCRQLFLHTYPSLSCILGTQKGVQMRLRQNQCPQSICLPGHWFFAYSPAWTVPRSTKLLNVNPITAKADVAFVRRTISHFIAVAQDVGLLKNAPTQPSSASNSVRTSWTGKYPHLCLIHAIIDDNDIKAAYKSWLHVLSGRMAVENRRTPAAISSNVWHMVAKKWTTNCSVFLLHPKK